MVHTMLEQLSASSARHSKPRCMMDFGLICTKLNRQDAQVIAQLLSKLHDDSRNCFTSTSRLSQLQVKTWHFDHAYLGNRRYRL